MVMYFGINTYATRNPITTMKSIFTLLIGLLFTTLSFGQGNKKINQNKKDTFIKQIDRLNNTIEFYGTLSPFSGDNRSELIDSARNELTTQLLEVLNDNRILKYQMEKLITPHVLSISRSADNKVYLLSYDEKTGGSYRSSKTFIHYRLSNGTVRGELFGGGDPDILTSSAYEQIYTLDSANQKYFVIGGVQTCNTCYASVAVVIQIDSSSYQTNLVDEFNGRIHDLLFFGYNDIEKEFTYEYYAASKDDSFYEGDNENGDLQHKYKGKIKYLNGAFKAIEKCESWGKREN
jgi:hypothetical protein